MIRLPNHFSDHWIIVENTIVVIKNNKNYFNKKNIIWPIIGILIIIIKTSIKNTIGLIIYILKNVWLNIQ